MRVAGLLPQANGSQDSLGGLVLSESRHPSCQRGEEGNHSGEVSSKPYLPQEQTEGFFPEQEDLGFLRGTVEESCELISPTLNIVSIGLRCQDHHSYTKNSLQAQFPHRPWACDKGQNEG